MACGPRARPSGDEEPSWAIGRTKRRRGGMDANVHSCSAPVLLLSNGRVGIRPAPAARIGRWVAKDRSAAHQAVHKLYSQATCEAHERQLQQACPAQGKGGGATNCGARLGQNNKHNNYW